MTARSPFALESDLVLFVAISVDSSAVCVGSTSRSGDDREMKLFAVAWLIAAGCETTSSAAAARGFYCVYVGPKEPVLIASCYRTVEECANGHMSKTGSCISAPYAFCGKGLSGQREACFFELDY